MGKSKQTIQIERTFSTKSKGKFNMDQLVDTNKRAQMEYSTQFFGFSPDSFIDTMIGNCTEIVESHLQSAKKRCLEAFEGKVLESDVDERFAAANERYIEATERIFYKFGCYLRSQVLSVPPEILLPEDSVHANPERAQYDGADQRSAEDKFESICQKVKNAKLERAVLRNKVKNLEEVHKHLEVVLRRAKAVERNEKMSKQIAEKSMEAARKSEVVEKAIEALEKNLNMKRKYGIEEQDDKGEKKLRSEWYRLL